MSNDNENRNRLPVTDHERDVALNRQLPPTNTKNVMPKVKPPKSDDKK